MKSVKMLTSIYFTFLVIEFSFEFNFFLIYLYGSGNFEIIHVLLLYYTLHVIYYRSVVYTLYMYGDLLPCNWFTPVEYARIVHFDSDQGC